MASIITTFYRKVSSKDTATPDPEIGGVALLDTKDPSPFGLVGEIYPGEQMAAVVNNLYKAPLFFHESGDFLAIRSKSETGSYYIRKIENLACVGQTLPMDEAFSPHSRRHNVFCKNRLKVAAYRIFYEKGNRERKMWIQQLDAMFPHFSEGSKRKWLKEYAECVKRGKENVWVLKPTAPLLSEEDLRRCITPEQVCQYESMLAEERRLKDAGIVLASTGDEEAPGDEEELRLTVWNLTRNYVNAAAGKGTLEIVGSGDPTGIGEGFSFVRLKKKDKEPEEEGERKTTVEQLQQYRDEIKRIWDLQAASLRSKKEIARPDSGDRESLESRRPSSSLQTTPRLARRRSPHDGGKSGKVLSITRTVIRDGKRCQETEVITDPRIIDAYMKARKKQRREEARTSLRCGSCGQIGHMKTNKACINYQGKAMERKKEGRKKSPRIMLGEIILGVVRGLFAVPFSIAFHRPVSLKKFPNYREFVSHPIDLTTIKSKSRAGEYARYSDFLDDIKRMHSNCNTYNGPGHSLTKVSNEMVEIAIEAREKSREAIRLLEEEIEAEKYRAEEK